MDQLFSWACCWRKPFPLRTCWSVRVMRPGGEQITDRLAMQSTLMISIQSFFLLASMVLQHSSRMLEGRNTKHPVFQSSTALAFQLGFFAPVGKWHGSATLQNRHSKPQKKEAETREHPCALSSCAFRHVVNAGAESPPWLGQSCAYLLCWASGPPGSSETQHHAVIFMSARARPN